MAKAKRRAKGSVPPEQLSDDLPIPAERGAGRKYKQPENQYETREYWTAEISAAKKRDEDYRKTGQRARDIYAGKKQSSTPFNILFANTEIMLPAVYSQTPRPDVRRRYKDKDPIGQAAAAAGKSMLEFLVDTNIEGYETYSEGMKAAAMDALLPGRGITSVKYDAEVADVPAAEEGGDATPVKNTELVCMETRQWDRILMGYARKWSRVPWIAYLIDMDYDEVVRIAGEDVANSMTFTAGNEQDEEAKRGAGDEQKKGERKTAGVWQIWDKAGGRKIRYYSQACPDVLMVAGDDDPLELTGFFDTPRPLMFIEKTSDMQPTAPYLLYENQAIELNRLSIRIKRIIEACKARGAYDSSLGDEIERIMSSDDNELVPIDKGASIAAEKGLDNAIWFLPLETLVTTLRELVVAREQCKQVIYEIMGISDIVRGASKASETLGAQELKSQWGTLRLKSKQAEVARYARDHLRLMLEIAANKFSERTWASMTGLPYLTEEQFGQARQQMQALQAQAVQMQAQAAPGQLPPPELVQQMEMLKADLAKPKWADVLGVLKNDLQRAYRIDIETNSTLEPEAAEDQKSIADLMNALSQFLNGVGPMIAEGILPFEVAKTMLMSITRRFKFGGDIEDQIGQMQAPKPKPEEGDGGAAEKDAIKSQATIAQLQTQLKEKDAQLAMMQKEQDLANRERDLKTEQELFRLEQQRAQESLASKSAGEGHKLEGKKREIDHKQQISGLQEKQAKDAHANVKNADSKISQVVQKLEKSMSDLVKQVETLAKQSAPAAAER